MPPPCISSRSGLRQPAAGTCACTASGCRPGWRLVRPRKLRCPMPGCFCGTPYWPRRWEAGGFPAAEPLPVPPLHPSAVGDKRGQVMDEIMSLLGDGSITPYTGALPPLYSRPLFAFRMDGAGSVLLRVAARLHHAALRRQPMLTRWAGSCGRLHSALRSAPVIVSPPFSLRPLPLPRQPLPAREGGGRDPGDCQAAARRQVLPGGLTWRPPSRASPRGSSHPSSLPIWPCRGKCIDSCSLL